MKIQGEVRYSIFESERVNFDLPNLMEVELRDKLLTYIRPLISVTRKDYVEPGTKQLTGEINIISMEAVDEIKFMLSLISKDYPQLKPDVEKIWNLILEK